MGNEFLIKNGEVVFLDRIEKVDIHIKGGFIIKVDKDLSKDKSIDKNATVIDAKGLHVFSGFIDLHTHLREPGQTNKETIAAGAKAAVAGGFTTVCCMPNTKPALDNVPLIEFVKQKAKEANLANVLPIGCITKGQEGKELAAIGNMLSAGAVAFSDDGMPVENGGLMKNALEYAKSFNALLISHPEDKSIAKDGVVNEGYNASIAGLKGISRVAEESMIARDILLAEAVDTKIHIAHVSTKGGVALVRDAKKRGVKVSCETCPHYFSATDVEILDYNTNAKMNPPLREESDRLAIIEGLKDGTIDCIATDHAPHTDDEKNVEFDLAPFGITGLETAFSLAITYLVKSGHIDLITLNKLLSVNPAKIIALHTNEMISVGKIADITLCDINAKVTVDTNKHFSKGKNTFFNGRKLIGQVKYTIVNGEIKYKHDTK